MPRTSANRSSGRSSSREGPPQDSRRAGVDHDVESVLAGDLVGETAQRTVRAVALLVTRGAVVAAFGLGANLALARLLEPRDFGIVALGTVLLVFGTFLSDAGLGAALIRRGEPPTRAELEAVNGAQLGLMVTVAGCVAAVAIPIGRDGAVIAAMVASLPIIVLKAPSLIVLERRVDYNVIAKVDVVEAAAFYAWALVAVALGAGVWGFATAVVARAVVGAAMMGRLGPVGVVRPRLSWQEVRPLAGFGAKFQAPHVVALVRDQSLNVGVAVIAGVATLGVWHLAWRVLQIPFMVFGQFGRVGFPAMARLVRAGGDPRPVIERGGAAVAIVSGAIMVALVAFAPALPTLLGPGWQDVPAVLLWAGVTLTASFPVVLASSPYLLATGAVGTVVRPAILGAVVWLGVGLGLLNTVGAPAIAIGWCAGAVLQLTLLGRQISARTGAAMSTSLGVPIALGVAAGALGWLIADGAGRTIAAGLLGVAAGEAMLWATLALVRPAALGETRRLVARAFSTLAGAPTPATPPTAAR
jgi:O-antigen/teichoic acid export membrane protein